MGSTPPVALAAAALLVSAAAAAPAFAPSSFASAIAGYAPGPGASPAFSDPALALGGPQGCGLHCGTLDVVALGVGGSLTLSFDAPISNGKGDDFIVFENSFQVDEPGNPTSFAEVVFVEVSSGGPFARFPADTVGVGGPIPSFGTVSFGAYDGLAGAIPTLANVVTNTIDPLDPTVAGGSAFDLSDLGSDPLVLAGQVDLDAITAVRLVDVEAGTTTDVNGNLIHDSGGATGAADIDAVSIINHAQNRSPRQPGVEISRDQQGFIRLVFSDPEGLGDLDPSTLRMSADLTPVFLSDLLAFGFVQVVSARPTRIELKITPFLSHAWVFSVSIRDMAGRFCVDQAAIQ